MMSPEDRAELLWASIEAGTLDDSAAADTEIVARFAAYQKLESLFAMLREPSTLGDPLDQPSQIGRYRVEKVLGEGAFGRVYLAHDPELERLVAIKMPRADIFSSEQDADRFLGEAKLAASLTHPGIVTIHDVGREAKSCFIVMEYVEGQTLQELINAGELPRKQAAELVARVADALHYAHKKGFVHRDLKPGNVLVDDQGRPHVTDFGLAVSEESQRLHAGQVAGTPAYMSPEQVRGETQHLDGRTDIWSLGVIFYQLLTGRHPFWRGDPAECLDAIEHREPKPPRQIDDTIPEDLQRITLKCLARQTTERYNAAGALAADLRYWRLASREGATFERQQPITVSRLMRNRVRWAIGGLVLVLGVVGAMVAIAIRSTNTSAPVSRLVTRPPNATILSPAEERIEEELKSLTDLAFIDTPLSDVVDTLSLFHEIPIRIDYFSLEHVGIPTDVPITFESHGVSLRSALQSLLDELTLTYTIKDEALLITTPEMAEYLLITRTYPVTDLVRPGDRRKREQADFQPLIGMIKDTVQPLTWVEVGGSGSVVGMSLANSDVLVVSQTLEVHLDIQDLLSEMRGADDGTYSGTQSTSEKRNLLRTGSIKYYTAAIGQNPSSAYFRYWRGVAYANSGDFDKAIADFTEAIRLDANLASASVSRASVYYNMREFQSAVADCTEAIRLDPKMAGAYFNRGLAYEAKGEKTKAEADFAKTRELGWRPDGSGAQ